MTKHQKVPYGNERLRKAPYKPRVKPVPGNPWGDKEFVGPQDLTTLPGWAADYPCKHNRCKAYFGEHPTHHGKCEATHDVWGQPFKDPNRIHFGGDCNTPWCHKHPDMWTGWQEFRDWRESVTRGDISA